jgi:hypothetical protein
VSSVGTRAALALAFLTGCRLLTGPSDRLIALEVTGSAADTVTAGDTVRLHARALAAGGDSVPGVTVTWAILDTGAVGIELVDASGTFAARQTGTWHVQAAADSIRSDPIAITVKPGPAVALQLQGLADAITVGAQTSDTVTARDAFDNVAAGYAGTVRFAASDTLATLPADYAFTTADAGVHVFAPGVTLRTPGSQRVTVRDLADSTLSVVRDVTVIP